MKFRFVIRSCATMVALMVSVGVAKANELTVGDAYARDNADGQVWTIGTKSVEMTLDGQDGTFRLVSFLNKSCEPPLEYVDAKSAAAPFVLDAEADSRWALKSGAARKVASGGRPAVQLDVTVDARGQYPCTLSRLGVSRHIDSAAMGRAREHGL